MKIGEVAKRSNVGVDTVRYYERRGVLKARRTALGYRSFTDASVERIRFAKELQSLGFSLDEVVTLLGEIDRGNRRCDGKVSASFSAALGRIDAKLEELQSMRRRLEGTVDDCRRGQCLLAERAPRLRTS